MPDQRSAEASEAVKELYQLAKRQHLTGSLSKSIQSRTHMVSRLTSLFCVFWRERGLPMEPVALNISPGTVVYSGAVRQSVRRPTQKPGQCLR